MVEMNFTYDGNLRCSASHGPSGMKITTDAPRDNMGLGEAFSPTDLVGAALGTCMLTTMAIFAQRAKLDFRGATAKLGKEMTTVPTRRIQKLTVEIHIPGKFTPEQRSMLETAAHNCPVSRSVHADMQVPVTFVWQE